MNPSDQAQVTLQLTVFQFSVKIFTPSALAGGANKFFHGGSNPLSGALHRCAMGLPLPFMVFFSKISRRAQGLPSLPFNRYRVLLPGAERSGPEVNHSSPSGAEVKNKWSSTSSPSICLHATGMEKR